MCKAFEEIFGIVEPAAIVVGSLAIAVRASILVFECCRRSRSSLRDDEADGRMGGWCC